MRGSRWTPLVAGALVALCVASSMVACSSEGDAVSDGGVDATARDAIAVDARDASVAREDVTSDPVDADVDAPCAPSGDPYVAKWRPPKARASVCTSDDLEMFWVA